MPDATEAAVSGTNMGLEHVAYRSTQRQIRIAHDCRTDPRLAVQPAGTNGGDAVDELGLADRAQGGRPVLPIHRLCLHEHGRDDVVSGVRIGEQFFAQIAPIPAVPEMMMCVDDRQLRLEDRLP